LLPKGAKCEIAREKRKKTHAIGLPNAKNQNEPNVGVFLVVVGVTLGGVGQEVPGMLGVGF